MKSSLFAIILGLGVGTVMLLYLLLENRSSPATTRVAVATNFLETLEKLVQTFEESSEHQVTIVFGSSGKLYTQIKNGAPIDIFLSADTERPKLLEQEHLTIPKTFFVYAVGKLILWSKNPNLVDAKGKILATHQFERLAIGPVQTAPYGAAAKQALTNLGLWEQLWPRIIQSTNLTHLYQLIDNKEVQLGFLAQSQIIKQQQQVGSQWIVPQELYDPIEQGAVLLKRGQNNAAALAFIDFLQSTKARAIIEEFSYSVP